MGDDLAGSNVNRAYSLTATTVAIFTFMLFFLFPRYVAGEINRLLFQATLVVMGVATFSFVFAAIYYYSASAGSRFRDADRAAFSRRADRLWLIGFSLLLLGPGLVLYCIGLVVVAFAWLALWVGYLVFVSRYFPKVQTVLHESSPQ